jgi:hypothetical protein
MFRSAQLAEVVTKTRGTVKKMSHDFAIHSLTGKRLQLDQSRIGTPAALEVRIRRRDGRDEERGDVLVAAARHIPLPFRRHGLT